MRECNCNCVYGECKLLDENAIVGTSLMIIV